MTYFQAFCVFFLMTKPLADAINFIAMGVLKIIGKDAILPVGTVAVIAYLIAIWFLWKNLSKGILE